MTDVRHLHFGEPVPVNALADFSTEQARKQQAVFLGKDEQGQPVLVPRDTAQDQHSDPRPARERQERDGHQRAHSLRTRFRGRGGVLRPERGRVGTARLPGALPGLHPAGSAAGKPAQLNLFRDLDQYALKNLLVAGFNLSETGDVADHYRISEQKAAKLIAEQFRRGKHSAGAGGGIRAAGGLKRT